jgi:tetratricopeptide (TPR) repeat protein
MGNRGNFETTDPSTFVGRAAELAELRAALDDAAAGRGRLFLISGEPGIGKTRLADEFSSVATALGVHVLWGRCWEGAGAPAYWPWIQALKSVPSSRDVHSVLSALASGVFAPDSSGEEDQELRKTGDDTRHLRAVRVAKGPTADPIARVFVRDGDFEQTRFRLFSRVAGFLEEASRIRPLALVFDDLHDADQSSLLMLQFVARELRDAHLAIVGTFREAEVERSKPLSSLIARVAREGILLPLRGLNEADVAAFVSVRAAVTPAPKLVRMLHRATDGNPLFLDGVVRMLVADGKLTEESELDASEVRLPSGVRVAIGRQLEALSGEAREMLSIAATVGNEFEIKLLQTVSGRSGEEILDLVEKAARIGIISPEITGHGPCRFSHALIRGAIYEDIGANERSHLHERIAKAIEELHQSDLTPHLASLAHHFREARLVEKALDYSIRAGDSAYIVVAYAEAARHWRNALGMTSECALDPERHASLLCRLGDELVSTGPQAVEYLEAALSILERVGRLDLVADVHASLALCLAAPNLGVTNVPRAIEHVRKAEVLLKDANESANLCRFCIIKASACTFALHSRDGMNASSYAMEMSERLGRPADWAFAASSKAAFLTRFGSLAEGFALQMRARESTDGLANTMLGSSIAWTGGSMCRFLLDPDEAQEWCLRELNKPRTAQSRSRRQILRHDMCLNFIMKGELGKARDLLSPAQPELYRHTLLAFMEGDWELAGANFSKLLDYSRSSGIRLVTCDFIPDVARFHSARGEHEKAHALYEECLAISLDAPDFPFEVRSRSALSLICVDLGQAEKARPHLVRCREILAAGEDWRGLTGSVARAEAVFAAAEGRSQDAESHFTKAIEIFRRYKLPWEEAEALCYWGRALQSAGETRRAAEKFDAAIEIYNRIGAGQRWIDHLLADRERVVQAPIARPGRFAGSVAQAKFCKEGDYWTLTYRDTLFRIRDAKGLHYLAELLRKPNQQLFSIDLAALTANHELARATNGAMDGVANETVRDLGDAGEILDLEARAQYKRRLGDLREEIELAQRANDPGRTESARAEFEAIAEQLHVASGLGGRSRRAASHRERARVMVTKRIKASIESIRASNPALGRHLASSIRTGNVCTYSPIEPTDWQF